MDKLPGASAEKAENQVLLMILEEDFDTMPPVQRGRRGVSDADDEDDDYRRRRDRNNEVRSQILPSSF